MNSVRHQDDTIAPKIIRPRHILLADQVYLLLWSIVHIGYSWKD